MPILRKEMLAWKAQAELLEEQKCSIAWELHLSEGRVARLEGRVRWLLGRVRDLEAANLALQNQIPLEETAGDGEDEKDDDEEEEPGLQIKEELDDVEEPTMMKEEEEEEEQEDAPAEDEAAEVDGPPRPKPAGLVVTSASRSSHPDLPVARPSKSPRLL